MTIDSANILDKKLFSQNTRNGISEHQDFKIAARSFGSCVIPQCLKIIPVLHTQKVGQSAIGIQMYVHLTHA